MKMFFRSLLVAVIAALITGLINYSTLEKKIESIKDTLENVIVKALDSLNDEIKEIKERIRGSTGEEEEKIFEALDFDQIMTEIDFDKLDMNIRFCFLDSSYHAKTGVLIKYKPGEYKITPESALLILKVLRNVFNKILSGILENKKIETKIKGIADSIPVRQGVTYNEDLPIKHRYFHINENSWKTMELIPHRSLMKNETFAFLRAFYAYQWLRWITEIRDSPIKILVEEVEKIGARGTIIVIDIRVKEVIEIHDELNVFEKTIFDVLY